MATVFVKDSGGRPRVGVEVIVTWQGGGVSSRRTNSNGVADLETGDATMNFLQVNGQRLLGSRWVDRSTEIEVTYTGS